MVNTSNAYKEALRDSRIFHHKVEITFGDGRTVTAQDLMELYSFQILDSTSNTNSFDLGSAIAKQLNIRLDNTDGQYNDYDFSEAEISAKVGLELADGTTEWIDKGIYISEPGEDTGASITLKAYDNMIKFDRPYSLSKLVYPATLLQIVQDACSCCGVLFAPDSAVFDNSGFVVDKRPDDGALTFRQILQYVCQITCRYACITAGGKLSLRWYDTELLEAAWQKDEETIVSGNNNLVDVDTSDIVQVTDLLNGSSITTDDVVITGIKVTEDGETGSDETSHLSGTEDYALEITGNKLIQGTGEEVASFLGERLNGLRFRPVSVSCQGNPAVEAGDIGLIKDAKGRYYKTIFTETTYNAYAAQSLVCGAEAPVRKSSQRYSEATKVYQKLRAQLAYQKTEVEKAFEDLGKQMDSVQGLHPIREQQEDGSYILYLCDKPTLAESKIVIKLNAQGWGMSTDGGETWNVGALVDGTTITKMLYAIGINATYVNSGRLAIIDDDGNIIFEADIDKKSVSMNPDIIQIGGRTMTEALNSAKNIALQLSNEYQGISVDHDGNYTEFPAGISTTATVLYGSNDISADCTYTVSQSAAITGSWDVNKRTYTVTGLSAVTGWVIIRATYLSALSVSKKFTVSKVYAGDKGEVGEPGELYSMECSNLIVKKESGGYLYPYCLEFHGYRSGSQKRLPYSGRFVIEETADGTSWNTVYTSAEDEQEVIHSLYTAIGTESGKLIATADGNVLVTARNITEIRASLYAAGGTAELIDRQTIPVVVDMSALTHEDIFNLLTDDGRIKGIYKEGDQLYINATYLRSLHVTGNQVDAKKLKVTSADGTVTLYISDDGEVDLKVRSFSLAGKSVGDIAQAAVDGQSQEDIFNKLSKNGTIKGVKLINGELYFSFSFASGGTLTLGGSNNGNGLLRILDASGNQIGYIDNTGVNFGQGSFSGKVTAGDGTIGGWKIRTDYLESEDGTIRLYKSGRIVFGGDSGATLSANGKNIDIKNGLVLHTKRPDSGFSDFTGEFQLLNLGKVTSSKALAVDSNGVVGYIASSSRRYKDHIREATDKEAQKLLDLPVIWYKYKKGYLNAGDSMEDKAMPGFYAEDVASVLPELAVYDGDKVEDWNYRTMIPMLLKLIQTQEKRIQDLEDQIGGRL